MDVPTIPGLYHITSRGNERKKVYLDDSDRKKFLEILEDYHNRLEILTTTVGVIALPYTNFVDR